MRDLPPALTGAHRLRRSIRVQLGVLLGLVGVTVLGVALYLALTLRPAAAALSGANLPALELYSRITGRARTLNLAVEAARRAAVELGGSPTELNRLLRQRERSAPMPYARIPTAMRSALARVDEDISLLEAALYEFAAAAELGRTGELPRRLRLVDSLNIEVTLHLAEAQERGMDALVIRGRDLSARAIRSVLVTFAGSLLILLLVGWSLELARKRLIRPLGRLEGALDRVVRGELNVRLAPGQPDEMGRLARVFNDMTQVLRDRVEEQGRFAAAGQLFAGIAHEVNNPLMAITAVAETRLEEEVSPEHTLELQQIIRQSRRAAKLLAGLLRFARPTERQPGPAPVEAVVDSAVDLVSYRFGVDEVDVTVRVPPGLPAARVDPHRLEQVLVNLLSNALDAVMAVKPPRRVQLTAWEQAGEVHLAVEDNGPGIPPEIRPRLFRPFVTSKGRNGTGLGLYLSRQILREFGGELEAGTGATGGARFALRLPAAAVPGTASEAWPVAHHPGERRPLTGLRLLLVEDEEMVRRPLRRFLERRGAEVLEAQNGQVALDLLGQEPVDLVLSDLRMPVLDGVEMYAVLARTAPEIAERVLFLSGDLTRLAEEGLGVPEDRVLMKPVDLFQLERRIAELVGR